MSWGKSILKDLIVQASHGKYASCPAAWRNRRSYSIHALGVYCLKSIAMRIWYFTKDSAMSGSYAILAYHLGSMPPTRSADP